MPRDPQPTQDRLLDAAEMLFAQRGFHAVSVRDITRSAKVDVSLVHYHFGSLRELLAQVIARRATIVNRARLDALQAVQRTRSPSKPTVEEVLHAFVDPMLELCGHADPGWRNYFALLAQVNNSPELARTIMTSNFNECVERFIKALMEALPSSKPADIYWGYHFLSGALTLTFADTGRIDELSHGISRSSDFAAIARRCALFFAGGFKVLADLKLSDTRRKSPPTRRTSVKPRAARR